MIAMLAEAILIMDSDHQISRFFVRDSAAQPSIQRIDCGLAQWVAIDFLNNLGELRRIEQRTFRPTVRQTIWRRNRFKTYRVLESD